MYIYMGSYVCRLLASLCGCLFFFNDLELWLREREEKKIEGSRTSVCVCVQYGMIVFMCDHVLLLCVIVNVLFSFMGRNAHHHRRRHRRIYRMSCAAS